MEAVFDVQFFGRVQGHEGDGVLLQGLAHRLADGNRQIGPRANRPGGHLVFQQPFQDALRLSISIARVEQADQDHGIQAQAGQDAQVEVKGIEGGAHDLGVGHDDGEALFALGAEELQVKVHVGLLADTFEKALDDFWFHICRRQR